MELNYIWTQLNHFQTVLCIDFRFSVLIDTLTHTLTFTSYQEDVRQNT